MKNLAVIHYLPLERYPPVINFLNTLAQEKGLKVKVYTSLDLNIKANYENENIDKIYRTRLPYKREFGVIRLFKYLLFFINTFWRLVIQSTDTIIYFDSISAGPVFFYHKYFGRRTKLIIHFHEYFSEKWYNDGMKLVKFYHKCERNHLFRNAEWISQTNHERVRLFLNDNPKVYPGKMKVVPNYPPFKWIKYLDLKDEYVWNSNKFKLVYVGAISLEETYIKEICKWVKCNQNIVSLDIFSNNFSESAEIFLENLECDSIAFYKSGIEYKFLPEQLIKYDIGLVLYKAKDLNFKYNAPNKLFEYYRSALDIWCSDKMVGLKDILNDENFPIRYVDFEMLHSEKNFMIRKNERPLDHAKYSAEKALDEIINFIIEGN